jgi:hypothetical protein
MATVVCLNTTEKKVLGTQEYQLLDVVDGQQRLTTLILLLKAISKHLLNGSAAEQEEAKEIQKLLVKGDERLILLQTNHDSSMIFCTYLSDGALPKPTELHTHADKRLFDAMNECEKFVANHAAPLSLLKAIKNRLGFIFYELQDEGAVYTVFEVLNSRGIEVESIDKCKSMLMGTAFDQLASKPTAAHDRIKELHGYWKNIYKIVGLTRIDGSEILRFAATLRHKDEHGRTLNDDDALDFLRKDCSKGPKKVSEVSKWLLAVTKEIIPLYNNKRLSAVTNIVHARLLAVALLLTDTLDERQRKKALQQWESVTFRIFGMCGNDARTKGGDFTRLAHQIVTKNSEVGTYKKIMEALRILGEGYPIDESVNNLKNDNCYDGWEEELRYFLFRYEEHLAAEQKSKVSEEMWNQIWTTTAAKTIEHIYPQAGGKEWVGKLGMGPNSRHINRIGNLLILPPGINSEAGQKGFSEKKLIYKKNYLRMMDEVLEKQKWNLDRIVERERSLLKWACKAWDDVEE